MVDLAEENLQLRKQLSKFNANGNGVDDAGDEDNEADIEGAEEGWVDVSSKDVISTIYIIQYNIKK